MNKRTKLILVGGFLGAGKTQLMREAGLRFLEKGFRVGLITNDQAASLVDTSLLSHEGFDVKEVHGSCFCCDFGGLMRAIEELRRESNPDLILAEPVGSCTDLSATLLQPLKDLYHETIEISPFSVLIDPKLLQDLLEERETGLHPDALYIVRKQLEEADLIVMSKSDLLSPMARESLIDQTARTFVGYGVSALSSQTGEGLEVWMESMRGHSDGGERIVEMDYDRYASGEAVLGWLNATIEMEGEDVDWNCLSTEFLKKLQGVLMANEAKIGHVKFIWEAGDSHRRGNLTGTSREVTMEGVLKKGGSVRLTLNLRVQMAPETLESHAKALLGSLTAGVNVKNEVWNSFSPGRPNPTHRYSEPLSV